MYLFSLSRILVKWIFTKSETVFLKLPSLNSTRIIANKRDFLFVRPLNFVPLNKSVLYFYRNTNLDNE